LRGAGKSVGGSHEFSLCDLAEDVIETIADIGFESAFFIGHSMGGYIALEIARMYPSKLQGLGLMASHIFGDSEEKIENRKRVIDIIDDVGIGEALKKMPEKISQNPQVQKFCSDLINSTSPEFAIGALRAMAERKSAEDVWANLKRPRRIIAGRDDQIVPIGISRKMAAIDENIALDEIDDAAHMPMLENPQKTISSLMAFITQVSNVSDQ
jgi:pimeloyl-ACP methyl ester carboxylesterase